MERTPELIAIISFYNIAFGPQAFLSFSKKFRHCSIITFDGDNCVLIEFNDCGLKTKVFRNNNVSKMIKILQRIPQIHTIVCTAIYERKKVKWKPLWGRTCNEVCRYAAGIDVGLTFNPIHLYKKLLKYSGKTNYEILSHWKR